MTFQQVAGGVLTIFIALFARYIFDDDKPIVHHVALIWAAAFFAFIAACTALPIRESRKDRKHNQQAILNPKAETESRRSRIKQNFQHTLQFDWFKKFLMTRLFFLSIIETLPFYAMHAASLHKNAPGSLSTFVVFVGMGVLIGGPFMNYLSSKSLRLTMFASAMLAVLAAIFALFLEVTNTFTSQYYYAPVFFLMSAASMGGTVSIKVYIGEMAPETERTYFLATASIIVGAIGAVLAVALAFAAHFQDESVPIAIILVGNALAIATVYFLPGEGTAEKLSMSQTEAP